MLTADLLLKESNEQPTDEKLADNTEEKEDISSTDDDNGDDDVKSDVRYYSVQLFKSET